MDPFLVALRPRPAIHGLGRTWAKMKKSLCCLLALALPVVRANAAAGEPTVIDKSGFHLFNPTPTESLRQLSIDGPGNTESPYTVDAGHSQLELSLVSYTHDRESSADAARRFDAWSIGHIALKAGLLNQLDAQLVLETYNLIDERANGSRVTHQGFGDTILRFKYNLWGNDTGPTAFAVMPYVKFPTGGIGLGNNSVEGGLILPFETALAADFYLGFTTRFDALRDEDELGYHTEFINSIALSHNLFGDLAGYLEFFSAVSTERGAPWLGTFDAGLIYGLSDNVQLDAGTNLGLTHSADDWNGFLGLAWRF